MFYIILCELPHSHIFMLLLLYFRVSFHVVSYNVEKKYYSDYKSLNILISRYGDYWIKGYEHSTTFCQLKQCFLN